MVAIVKDDLPLLEELLIELVDESFKRVGAQVLEVDDVQQLALQPLLVLVLVLDKAIVEFFLDVREDVQQLVEILL